MRMAILLAAFPLLLAPPAAGQEDCAGRVDRLAALVGMPAELPEPGEGETLSDTLAQSGGVLEPPPEGQTPVIEPPSEGVSAMPTAPPVNGSEPTETPGSETVSEATTHVRVGSLLTGARQALEQGDEEACMARVDEALALLEEAPD